MTPQASSASRWPTRAASRSTVWAYQCRLCFGFCWLTAHAHTQHACAIILPRSTLSFELPTGSATPPFRGVRASSRSHARGGGRSQCTSQTRQERRQESVRTGHLPWIVPGVLGRAACTPQALCSLLYSSTSSGHGDGGEGPQRALLCSTHSLLWYPGVASLFGAPLASLFAGSAPGLAVLRSIGPTRPPASPSLTDQCSGPRRGVRLAALGILARRLLRRPHRL